MLYRKLKQLHLKHLKNNHQPQIFPFPTKTQRINKLILLLFLPFVIFLISAQAKAQNKPYNEEITVIATFDPIIPDAFKINQNPVVNRHIFNCYSGYDLCDQAQGCRNSTCY